MRSVTLTRSLSTDEGTPGELQTDGGFNCVTLELPYRDENKDGLSDNGRSCLPGDCEYVFRLVDSPKFGRCYGMDADADAPNRDHILIHAANLAGDVAKGYVSQLLGCIALGAERALFSKGAKLGKPPHEIALPRDQHGIATSGVTVKAFIVHMEGKPFTLRIVNRGGIPA